MRPGNTDFFGATAGLRIQPPPNWRPPSRRCSLPPSSGHGAMFSQAARKSFWGILRLIRCATHPLRVRYCQGSGQLAIPKPSQGLIAPPGDQPPPKPVRTIMLTYRMIWLDRSRRIIKSQHIDCPSDAAAISFAEREIGDCFAIEIWDRTRAVCVCGNPRLGSDDLPS